MAGKVRIKGGDRLLKVLRTLPAELQKEVKDAIRQGAEDLVTAARAAAPSDTGLLRRSIKARYSKKGLGVRVGVFFGTREQREARVAKRRAKGMTRRKAQRKDAFYAPLVEFGTKAKPARPFLIPIYGQRRRTIKQRIVVASKSALQKVKR